jgi:hypothetical protein
VGVLNHPGIYNFTTSTAVNGVAYAWLNGTSGVKPIPPPNAMANWEIDFIFMTGANIAETKYRVGLSNVNPPDQGSPTTGLYLEYINSTGCTANGTDASWFFASGTGTITRTAASGIAASTWYKLRIRSLVAGTVLMSMATNGGAYTSEVPITTGIPTVALLPYFEVVTCDTNTKVVSTDFWRYLQTGAVR